MCSKLILLLLFLLLAPVVNVGNFKVMPQELFLYTFFILYVVKNDFKIQLNIYNKYFLFYFLAYVFVLSLVTVLSFVPYTKFDIYMSRQMLQLFIASVLFASFFRNMRKMPVNRIEKCVLLSFIVLSVPSIIALLQYYDILGLQDKIVDLYQPFFGFTQWEDLKSFRATSVFKDFFSFAVYTVVLNTVIFYWYLVSKLSFFSRNILLFLFIFNYFSQLYVARTSLLFIPIAVIGIFPFLMHNKVFVKRYLVSGAIFSVGILIALSVINPEKFMWALKVLNIFNVTAENFSSVDDMSTMNEAFLKYLSEHLSMLTIPYHHYTASYTDQTFYTDNFYFQEIVRYGIYGIFLYFIFHAAAFWFLFKKRNILLLLGVILMILNYKGGNTLFMTTNIYMYAFIGMLLLSTDKLMLLKSSKDYPKIKLPTKGNS